MDAREPVHIALGRVHSWLVTMQREQREALAKLYEDGVRDRAEFYKTVDRLLLNPKSISAGELYGQFNLMTNEWFDGIVPKLVRECCRSAAAERPSAAEIARGLARRAPP